MMIKKIIFLYFGVLPVFCFSLFSQQISPGFMVEGSSKIVYQDIKNLQERSQGQESCIKTEQDGKTFYLITQHGKGNYNKFTDIIWEMTAKLEEKDGFVYVLTSQRIIKNKDGAVIITYEKNFDYPAGKVYFKAYQADGKIVNEKTFAIKGKITDNNTLSYFIRTFIAHRSEPAYHEFYLLSEEPSMYRIKFQPLGEETLNYDGVTREIFKARLIPQFGLLTGVAGSLVPPTFVYCGKTVPYLLYQYEGLECGLGTTHVIIRSNRE